ncbi:M16 family metallopeptidase [Minwuia sp.]|uniref:M16 family metallopeptidase n=1 Tax=Minwuia sp. TaxID=2493630 RepID=UPI003A91A399
MMIRLPVLLTRALAILMIAGAVHLTARSAQAADIVEVTSDSGVVAWLKSEPSIPIIAVNAMWKGAGAVAEPASKSGRSNLLAALLDEGAGEMDAQTFQRRLDDSAIRLNFETGRDDFTMTLQTLTANADEAFALAGLALSKPRFDTDALERMRARILNGISRDTQNPNAIAGRVFSEIAFGSDRYSQQVDGTIETVSSLTRADVQAHMIKTFGKDNLIIGVVGDITPEQLKPLLDKTFGDLPEIGDVSELGPATVQAGGAQRVIGYDSPQTVIVFGTPGIRRNDPDFDTARVMNHILGGGGFSSLLTEEIREKRGLTYGVYSYMRPMARGGMWLGGLSTSNEKAAEALTILKTTIATFRDEGVSEEQLRKAKANINGAFPLRFTSNSAIAGLLVAMQRYDLGKNYVSRRPERINAVTAEDVKRVASRILKLEDMIVVGVGRPDGIAVDEATQ